MEIKKFEKIFGKFDRDKYYISREGYKQYMRSDGEWMHCMATGTNWEVGGTYFDTREEAEAVIADLSKPKGPVREVVRKEIVPGFYGKVSVHTLFSDTGNPLVAISNGVTHKESTIHVEMSQDDLREAAKTLIEIADALEEI